MELNMRKYARKRLKSVLSARLRPLTTQIEADLVLPLQQIQYGHFAHWLRCKSLPQEGMNKVQTLPAALRLSSEQIDSYHFDPVYGFAA